MQGVMPPLPEAFIRLLGAAQVSDADGTGLVLNHRRFPVIEGIPILLKDPHCYLHRLCIFLEAQLEKLEPFRRFPPDRPWAEPQARMLERRLNAIRSVLGITAGGPLHQDADLSAPALQSRYDSEANTDLYTRIAWGCRSIPTGHAEVGQLPDAGDFYSRLATVIGALLPRNGVFLDLGCGVGRSVFDAAQSASEGLAIGLDLSLSKIARASAIVRGHSPVCYPIRVEAGFAEAQISALGQTNTVFAIGDAAQLPLPEHSVDCVLLSMVIGLVQDLQDVLRRLSRILKPEGSLVIADSFDAFYNYDYPSDHRITVEAAVQMLKQALPDAVVELTGSVSYEEHWTHSRTVTYRTWLVTAKRPQTGWG